MKKLQGKLENRKGFTLAELLIVVAIIAVLAAIAIPIFNNQLTKARQATNAANLRSAYAEASAALLTGETQTGVSVTDEAAGTVTVANVLLTKDGIGTNNLSFTVGGSFDGLSTNPSAKTVTFTITGNTASVSW